MAFSRKPAGRLPDHLQRLKRANAEGGAPSSARPASSSKTVKPKPAVGRPTTSKPAVDKTTTREDRGAPQVQGSGRLAELLPGILAAMVPGDARAGTRVEQGQILAALAPYHRPHSRFESLMMRKLVGEGYLKPLGARDKHGMSGLYELTPKGAKLLAASRGAAF